MKVLYQELRPRDFISTSYSINKTSLFSASHQSYLIVMKGVTRADWSYLVWCVWVSEYAEILQIDQIFSAATMGSVTAVMYQQRGHNTSG